MQSVSDVGRRINLFLYRQAIKKLSPTDVAVAKEWCVTLIRREHPQFTDEEVERFYENLIAVKFTAVDQWTQRMS